MKRPDIHGFQVSGRGSTVTVAPGSLDTPEATYAVDEPTEINVSGMNGVAFFSLVQSEDGTASVVVADQPIASSLAPLGAVLVNGGLVEEYEPYGEPHSRGER